MKRATWIVALVCVAMAMPAAAGGDKKPCSGDPQDCAKKIQAKSQGMGWMGIEFDVDKKGHFKVTHVVPSSPAEAAGFEAGDVLLAINGAKVSTEDKTALKKMKSLGPGAEVTYVVKRAGGKAELVATLGAVPDAVVAQWVDEHTKHHQAQKTKVASATP